MDFYDDGINRFRGEYEYLSNFYPARVEYDGLVYYSAEAAYQAQKCADPKDREPFTGLYADEAKHQGEKLVCRTDWDAVRLGVMEEIVTAKFTQNPVLAGWLADTKEQPLREGNSWRDLFWGVDFSTGEGENHLGRILMEIRGRLRKKELLPETGGRTEVYRIGEGITAAFGEIVQTDCACLVNAENEASSGGGVEASILRSAGPGLLEECRRMGGCHVAEARMTKGFGLGDKDVIHTAGPHYGTENARAKLEECYQNVLELAFYSGKESIALPVISVGKYCYPKQEGARIAAETVCGWLKSYMNLPLTVRFYTLDFKLLMQLRDQLAISWNTHLLK